MSDFDQARRAMLKSQIYARGVRDVNVLRAMAEVRRELFVPEDIQAHAYDDSPLPIGWDQTISQPYIVAFMAEALTVEPGDVVLEVGAGSGYASAVIGQIAKAVYAIERLGPLAQMAAANLAKAGCDNVEVRHADGTLGWQEHAPYDAILVSAGGPSVPDSLKHQLKVGGRLVIPIGNHSRGQELVRITRTSKDNFDREDLADVRFVPLIGAEGWEVEVPEDSQPARVIQTRPKSSLGLPSLLSREGDAFEGLDDPHLENALTGLLRRIDKAKVVLIGEASHGTSEFYQLRARLTQRLVAERGFNIVCAEADWPDAAQINNYVLHSEATPAQWTAFARFPTWMWRNEETRAFVDWLHSHNAEQPIGNRVGFYGLDLYSLYASARAVVDYLEEVDPQLAEVARIRYGCLSPWESDPAAYGRAAITGQYRACTKDVAHVLSELLQQRMGLAELDPARFMDATQNAQVVADAEAYYRIMYYGSRASWNLRDTHMFETLRQLLLYKGESAKAVVWAHNSHIGDARATEMSNRGEHNIGQLCAGAFGSASYRIGFGTDHGSVAAASNWDEPMQVMQIQPAHRQSYEYQFHLTNVPAMILPLSAGHPDVLQELSQPRLERAIGVIYRPETEMASHYFEAELPRQFDEYIWLDATSAVTPLETHMLRGLPDTYPFGV